MKKADVEITEYGDFWHESPGTEFNSEDVPEKLQPLIPYALFWGILDDGLRERLVDGAPSHITQSLKSLVGDNDQLLDAWLAGDESTFPEQSEAYLAFSAMRMAADYA